LLRRAAYLAQMLRNGSRTPAWLAARQSKELSALVRYAAARVPFYRDLYAAHGVRAASFNGLQDLHALPIVDKQQIRAAAAHSRRVGARDVTIRTSGSTGEPFEFQIDHSHDQWRKAQYLRPYISNGVHLRHRILRLTAHPRHRAAWFTRLGLLRERQLDCASDPAFTAGEWERLRPDVLQGYPSSLRLLAHHCLERGRTLQPAPQLVFTDSELLLPDTRALLEEQFGAPVLDVFGTFETDNIAFQCLQREGYHVATDCVVLEIVRDGKPVPIGEEGEIVVTVLGNRTLPFIRYNLRDIGRLSQQPCPCGLSFPLLAVLQGRANDQIVLANGARRPPPAILAHLARFIDTILQYQLRQIGFGCFELLIVPSSRFSEGSRGEILRGIATALGNAKVELRLVDTIPPDPSGKRRAFVSALAAGARATGP
jgi:phenylacetate-CoA ligase